MKIWQKNIFVTKAQNICNTSFYDKKKASMQKFQMALCIYATM